ncbi:hypothetical protein ASPZODRAFT_12584 [Penicilliopsis zonata CBS 506.65]|uniref:Uncharacterized protein n=1 Tax=Penicilliopsis zonata CBS 506.65 TaxID=1073090 RepID=A0A1L9SX62_9EURO|nr:hypothetical protein ASPZODRAFT_12584 [Penicilliopsis zonata CBS 506.65]OJJ51775.1 hypothetical protein ASPZODRAFT_12584 [Penicilliopsis zonata CBS 506.65]
MKSSRILPACPHHLPQQSIGLSDHRPFGTRSSWPVPPCSQPAARTRNAMIYTRRRVRPSNPATMTSDKQPQQKPFTPSLSAAFHRSNNKSPLTPKLATASTYHHSPRYPSSEHPSALSSSRDDLVPTAATPCPVYLAANVTPRSGPRSSRRDGVVSSPSSAQHSPQPSISQQQQQASLRSNGGGYRVERSPVRGTVRSEPSRNSRPKTVTENNNNTHNSNGQYLFPGPSAPQMFFHASDAWSATGSDSDAPRPRPSVKPPHPTTFIYANGEEEQKPPSLLPTKDSGSTVSSVKRRSFGIPRPTATGKQPHTAPSPHLKSPKVVTDASSRLSSEDARPQIHSLVGNPVENIATLQTTSSLLNSLHDRQHHPPTSHHAKAVSIDLGNFGSPPREREGLRPSPLLASPSGLKNNHSDESVSSEPITGLRHRVFSNGSTVSLVDTHSHLPLQSPVRTETPRLPAVDPAVNARTERKILDLEISNSSLLAINRTLEREMRKQNAELRRYRRLSRSGRLSVAADSTRSFSGTALPAFSEGDEAPGSERSSSRSPEEDPSEFSDDDEEEEEDDEDDENSIEDESVLSPESLAEHDAKHREADEKRFKIDLSKHQELLVDSQKMNQSLKRCLGWTEELIKEARKALEYHVHISDVELGGRVLSPEELPDGGESGRGLLSPSAGLPTMFSSDLDEDLSI